MTMYFQSLAGTLGAHGLAVMTGLAGYRNRLDGESGPRGCGLRGIMRGVLDSGLRGIDAGGDSAAVCLQPDIQAPDMKAAHNISRPFDATVALHDNTTGKTVQVSQPSRLNNSIEPGCGIYRGS